MKRKKLKSQIKKVSQTTTKRTSTTSAVPQQDIPTANTLTLAAPRVADDIQQTTHEPASVQPVMATIKPATSVPPHPQPPKRFKMPKIFLKDKSIQPPSRQAILHTNRSLFFLGMGCSVAVIVLTVIIVLLWQTQPQTDILTQNQPVTSPEPVKASPSLDKTKWTIEVLNGSGVSGTASKTAKKLEALGFTIMDTGNADKSNYKGTHIFVTKDLETSSEAFLQAVNAELVEATLSGSFTSETSTASARIIVGK